MSAGSAGRLMRLRHATAGRWLPDAGCLPALLIRSTARRARETWALAAGQLGAEVPARFDERVYAAEQEDLLEVVSEVSQEVKRLLLVGHNPGLEEPAVSLARARRDPPGRTSRTTSGHRVRWITDPDGVRIAVGEVPADHPLRFRP
ncbi:hypothetical protein M8Z33_03260 [Streptomyces sp. ZAF1911]|uniref:SixA phosphatase family protein n=1 Tax=Streptomyces sp. ZAF1911 TaxID=2944129 RepID=UPI00237AD8E1|nr:hypothetical protein [Streptomyces sp. ZAF1911]MDD9375709.1 hypothetical protein [Streptomyces sp. ZAF1911]